MILILDCLPPWLLENNRTCLHSVNVDTIKQEKLQTIANKLYFMQTLDLKQNCVKPCQRVKFKVSKIKERRVKYSTNYLRIFTKDKVSSNFFMICMQMCNMISCVS